jgi:hypothetical protein
MQLVLTSDAFTTEVLGKLVSKTKDILTLETQHML